jgi:hypothetical protein
MDRSHSGPQPAAFKPEVSIIVPARNEEANLGNCLQSLVTQTGVAFEMIVVDDGSTDRTRQIAESFAGVKVISAPPLPAGWTGKNNAVIAGASVAAGEWLLFTDADTVHVLGSLAGALAEAKTEKADLLSYSPEQIAVTFWEMAVLPVAFAELAREYPPKNVSDPSSPEAAANGQYILVRRGAYDAVGGHLTIADDILEDVALARAMKGAKRKILFRYAAGVVRTRMYRNFAQLREGWTKNLALLFPSPGKLASRILIEWTVAWVLLLWPLVALSASLIAGFLGLSQSFQQQVGTIGGVARNWWWSAIPMIAMGRLFGRLRRANFDFAMEFLGVWVGMPTFAYLLFRSKRAHAKGQVSWKGRTYGAGSFAGNSSSKSADANSMPTIKKQVLRTEN